MYLIFAFLLVAVAPLAYAESLFVAVPDHATAVDGGLSRGVAFGDADGDGDPDLLVANTINYPEFLYRNDGERFVQVMETAPSLSGGFTEGVNWVDFDNDGDLDIFAARTNGSNGLYRNDGSWSFAKAEAGDTLERLQVRDLGFFHTVHLHESLPLEHVGTRIAGIDFDDG